MANRLDEETSPYLLQHRDNPVAWQPWGDEAFEAARREGKPVLLSVGYAACHWCHVMAHECFENPDIAAQMNQLYVNIKVDREERPDVDSIYQSALALLGEHGGWPLTMFLTPEGKPFWGGTYFPPSPRFGRPGLPQVLQGIAEIYANDSARVTKNTTALKDALGKLSQNQAGEAISLGMIDQIAAHLVKEIDPLHGGIGSAPKFPQPAIMKLLWRAWKRSGDPAQRQALRQACELTMTKMSQGGIYDHLGGGFARYSVDAIWLAPHFEKMLYDNAQLLEVLGWLWQDTANPLYEQRIRETVAWTLREMIADGDGSGKTPSGAFAATLDADSEGEEGKFYVWSESEIDALLGAEAELFKTHYDVGPGGNWEGKTILNRTDRPLLAEPAVEARLAAAREKLFAVRSRRIWPGWDDKVLADWNGLMIAALAELGPLFGEASWLVAAEEAFAFVCREMQRDGRLFHSWRHGRLKHPATLDDYANMAAAALALYEATAQSSYLHQAEAWVGDLDRHYWDDADGGYFLTADDTRGLIVRTKTPHDNAVPSGNGTIIAVLAKLFYLTGRESYRHRAEAVMRAFSGEINRNFFPLATLLNSTELLSSAVQIVIVGDKDAADTADLLAAVRALCLPNRVLQVIAPAESLPENHPASGKGQSEGRATAYVCHGPTCSLPITAPAALTAALAPSDSEGEPTSLSNPAP
ncbi:thioredoxin domain-containing protein [Pelagibius litoralis]|uniref:Thioredoxin domain-containing protein n=1 Tax=Pelagibius litoralis TaxID=374515 RepID=A0A967KCI6_9PROT|nr:thioredoxin domain-containing protein [Pelagibius litoralis]